MHEITDIKDNMLLDPRFYFRSLFEKCAAYGVMTEAEINKIMDGLLLILSDKTNEFNRGESSSVTVEKAEEIMMSIMFVISLKLKSYNSPKAAISALKEKSPKLLYEGGIELARRKIAVCRHLQKRIADNLFDTPNIFYRSTIIDGINAFFKLYSLNFQAHEIHITADYPVLAGRPEADGIEFIEEYLRCILAENAFLRLFDPWEVHNLLSGFSEDYKNIPMNLFEPVLLSALGLIMVNRSPKRLDLEKEDICFLQKSFGQKSKYETEEILKKALLSLKKETELSYLSGQYAYLCMPNLVSSVHNGAKLNTLDKVFLMKKRPSK